MDHTKTSVISIRNLVKTYHPWRTRSARVAGVSFDVEAGEFLAVTGPSGSEVDLMHILKVPRSTNVGPALLDGQDVSTMTKISWRPCDSRKSASYSRVQPAIAHIGTRQRRITAALRKRRTRSRRAACPRDGGARRGRSGAARGSPPEPVVGRAKQRVAIARTHQQTVDSAGGRTDGNLDTRTSLEVMDLFQQLNQTRDITVLAHHPRDGHRRTRHADHVVPRWPGADRPSRHAPSARRRGDVESTAGRRLAMQWFCHRRVTPLSSLSSGKLAAKMCLSTGQVIRR